jgi:glucose/arabinose dehydrogenase
MMAAAQAAAEAALREVQERNQNDAQQQSTEPSEATLAALLQQGSQEGQSQVMPNEVFATEGGMQSLLHMMAQEEQQRQQIAALAAIASRPKEHYISIAQNGEFMIEDRTFFISSKVPYFMSSFSFFHVRSDS